MQPEPARHRRAFLKSITAMAAAAPLASLRQTTSQTTSHTAASPTGQPAMRLEPSVFGPRPGYTPQIGIFVSQLTWMQHAVVSPVKGLTQPQLDWLFDANANSIGALLLHLAATETYYQMNTFGSMAWDSWSPEIKAKWDPAMDLGDAGRKSIKGHELDFYLTNLQQTRERTLAEFKTRDDAWFMAVDETWPWGATNNYCKWFHVCEHESHHAGQIDMLIKRVPGANAAS